MPREAPGPLPPNAPSRLVPLALDTPYRGKLDCARRECNHWYRVDVPSAGALVVEMDPDDGPQRPVMRMLVRELGGPVLEQTMGGQDGAAFSLEPEVEPGVYLVLVQGGGEQPYTLTVSLRPPARPRND